MGVHEISFAKITCPKIKGVLPRERLFRRLDKQGDRPITWITAPAGSGKTTLAAGFLNARKIPFIWYRMDEGDADISSFFYYMGLAALKAASRKKKPMPFLTPEYLQGVPYFTRRWFEELFNRVPRPFTLVFDNFHEVPESSDFHAAVVHGFETIPDNVSIIVSGRTEPPAQFARLRVNQKIELLGWSDIKLSEEESCEVIKMKCRKDLADYDAGILSERAAGWAAGLVLMAEAIKNDCNPVRSAELSQEAVFDYFAGEIFAGSDVETREFLMKTSFLPDMDGRTTAKLTGACNSAEMLGRLSRRGYFTERLYLHAPVYRYHPLFKDFLQLRAMASFSRTEISSLKSAAASLLIEAGRAEDAALLLRRAENWEKFISLVLVKAPALLSEGRGGTLIEWIEGIPAGIVEESPWLLYWLGVCRLPTNPVQSRIYLEKAFCLFEDREDMTGALLSWAGVVESVLMELDDFTQLDAWIDWMDRSGFLYSPLPSPEIGVTVASLMSHALQWRRIGHADKEKWVELALSFARQTNDVGLKLRAFSSTAFYFIWNGDFAGGRMVTGEIGKLAVLPDASPLTMIMWKTFEACMCTTTYGSNGSIVRTVSEGLEISRSSGIHIWDMMLLPQGVYGAMNEGDLPLAADFLKNMDCVLGSGKRNAVGHYYFLSAWIGLLTGSTAEAEAHAERALALTIECGTPFPEMLCRMVKAYILCRRGQLQDALELIERALALAEELRSPFFENRCLLARAVIAFEKGDERAATEALTRAMELGRKHEYITMSNMWQPAVMSQLCARALKAGIEIEYVRDMIQKLELIPDDRASGIEDWPWPLKIYTLGGFELQKDGKPLAFSRKAPQKPLQLLKMLVMYGAGGVNADRLADLLWPEAEGDAAYSSLTTTLSRLRQLLGDESWIIFHEGKVMLSPGRCWVDAWAFERGVEKMEELLS